MGSPRFIEAQAAKAPDSRGRDMPGPSQPHPKELGRVSLAPWGSGLESQIANRFPPLGGHCLIVGGVVVDSSGLSV